MKHLFQVLTLGSYLICLVSGKANITAGLSFDCASNGSMLIFGAEAASFGSIYATGTNGSYNDTECYCSKHVYGLNVTHEIRNCDIKYPVKVILMHENQTLADATEVVGGMNVSFYQLSCNTIPIGGLSFTRKYNLTDGAKLNYTSIEETTFHLVMEVLYGGKSIESDTIPIGAELHLVISGEVGFNFYLETCIASDDTHTHSKTLVQNGLTMDKYLLTNFTDSNSTTRSQNSTTTTPANHTLDATLYAFHFVGSHVVEIVCNITVCESDDSSCNFRSPTTRSTLSISTTTNVPSPASGRRKRDVAPAGPRTQTLRTYFTVVDTYVDNVNDVKTSGASKGHLVWLSLPVLLVSIVRA